MVNNKFEIEYKKLLNLVINEGELTENRTAVKTFKVFNQTLNINLKDGFPILTSKKVDFNKGLHEFLWIWKGRTDLEYLNENSIKWWNDFAVDNKLGRVYGYQVRSFNGLFDQIKYCIKEIKNNSRRAVVSLWNPCDLDKQVLPCCYTSFNFVRINNKLNMTMDFRSSDLFLGLPYDIIVGALLLESIAQECNLEAAYLGLNLKDAHIYETHKKAVKKYCENEVRNLPILNGTIDKYTLINYKCDKFIKADIVL